MFTVNIKFNGVPAALENITAQICRIFAPKSSYVDTAAYAGTVYDTNVDGFGANAPLEPFASTSVPFPVALAQFKLAVVGANNEVTFDVADYKEAFYYKTIGDQMADQGFTVTVGEVKTQTFAGTGSATTFTVTDKPAAITKVTVGGVDTEVTYAPATGVITFASAPAANAVIVATYSI